MTAAIWTHLTEGQRKVCVCVCSVYRMRPAALGTGGTPHNCRKKNI